MKTKLVVLLTVVVGCAVAGGAIIGYHALRKPTPQPAETTRQLDVAKKDDQPRPTPEPVNLPAAPAEAPPVPEVVQAPPEVTAADSFADNSPPQPVRTGPPPAPRPARTAVPAPGADVLVPEPVARQALSFVGADAEAEMIWTWAINDPNLPRDERRELIEDLNRDGFPDSKNPTAEDLPLIVSRIALIERLAPYAMDEVNAAAFAEAYKDLVNMYNRLTGN